MKAQRPYLYKAIYDWLLDNRWTPYLLVDATHPDAIVPPSFVQNGRIILNLSPGAIHNYFVDESCILFSARFSGQSQQIQVPFAAAIALYAKENAMGMVFPEEIVKAERKQLSEKPATVLKSVMSEDGSEGEATGGKNDSGKANSEKTQSRSSGTGLKIVK